MLFCRLHSRYTSGACLQRIEEILRRHSSHAGGPVRARGRRTNVALAVTLDLVEDNTNQDDQENASKSATEGDQDDDAVRVVTAFADMLVMAITQGRKQWTYCSC